MSEADGQHERQRAADATARVTTDGSSTLFSERFGETFHSDRGAVTEARHIFLDASGMRELLQAQLSAESRNEFSGEPAQAVLEVGFGLGLNFSLTAELALECGANLRYVAFERELLPLSELTSLNYADYAPRVWPELLQWRERLAGSPSGGLPSKRLLPQVSPSALPRFSVQAGAANVELQVISGDASQLLTADSRLQLPAEVFAGPFDAVYQDAFSPAVNPELWSPAFLQGLLSLLRVDGRLVTYSVSGNVRRALQQLGADVSRQPGPAGGKRQMLLAAKTPR